MRIARTAALAAVLLLAAAGCTSRPVAGASPGGSVTIPGGGPAGGDVTVSVAECTKCHGDAARVATATDARGIEIAPPRDVAGLQTGGTKIGAHLAHLRPTRWRATGVPCASCHVVPATAAAHVPGVLFRGLARAAWPGKPAIDPQYGAAGSCVATYCHGNFTAGANLPMAWTDVAAAADCGTCHGIPPLATHAPSATNCATCHGGSYTSTSVDPALHMNGQLDGGNESSGGTSCGTCHAAFFDGMNGTVAKVSKHTLGTDSPVDGAFSWTGADLGSSVIVANRSCITMCHGDHPHDLTSPATATHENNVYLDATTQASRAGGSATRVGAGGTGTQNRARTDFDSTLNAGVCASCHQRPIAAGGITVAAAEFGASAHDFSTSAAGTAAYTWSYQLHDGGLFARNCTKCHASRVEGNTPAVGSGAVPFGAVHFSDTDPSLLAGAKTPNGSPANFVCYNCHGSAAAPAAGAQGNRSGIDIQSQIAHATAAGQSGHPADSDAVHDSEAELANAAFGNALGVAAGAGQRHASCLDCHEPHRVQAGTHAQGTNVAGPPLQGAWGAKLGGALAAFAIPTAANFTKTTIVAGTDLEATLCFKCHSAFYGTLPTSPSGGFAETDQAREFNTANPGFHPVLATDSGTIGNTANLVAPWTRTSLMTCTDCHESSVVGDPNGPHGSASRFILKGPNTAWSNTLVNNGTMNGAFCANCHNASFANSRYPAHTISQHFIPCMNCHAAVPHGGPRPAMLVAPAGADATVGGTIAGWDGALPYSNPGTPGDRLYLKSYPANNTTAWAVPNCGCNQATGGGGPH